MSQQQLFALPAAYAISIRLEANGTWSLMVSKSYVGQPFSELDRSTYSDLSLTEALSIVDVVVSTG